MPETDDPKNYSGEPAFIQGAALGLERSSLDEDVRLRFFDSVRTTVLKSLELGPISPGDAPALFVFSDQPRRDALRLGSISRKTDLD